MSDQFCPGAKLLRQPKPEMFSCPQCGEEVEIWSDELRGTCPSCGTTVLRDGTTSCLDWCKFGKECVGEETYNNYMKNKAEGLREKLLTFAEEKLSSGPAVDSGTSVKRIKKILKEAEQVLKQQRHNDLQREQPGTTAEWHIVIPAAILSGIPIDILVESGNQAAKKRTYAHLSPGGESERTLSPIEAITTFLVSYGLQEEHAGRIARLIELDHPELPESDSDAANRKVLKTVLDTFTE
jgi:DNA-directed RNA polymerase subunit RPC12/RpoP